MTIEELFGLSLLMALAIMFAIHAVKKIKENKEKDKHEKNN